MKKLFLVLAVASLGFVACNNEAETETITPEDSARVADSIANALKMEQDKMMADTTGKMMSDTLKK
jgi:hypothetical protein